MRVVQLAHGKGLPLPAYQSDGAAGLDLIAAVAADAPVTIAAGRSVLIPTGLVLELPPDSEAQVRPRSGLALKHGVTVLNSPGTIDCDYRGEVQVLLINLGAEAFVVRRGERIAQLVLAPVVKAKLALAESLSGTGRGAGGFGSTGAKAEQRKGKPARTARKKRGAKKTVAGRPAPRRPRAGK